MSWWTISWISLVVIAVAWRISLLVQTRRANSRYQRHRDRLAAWYMLSSADVKPWTREQQDWWDTYARRPVEDAQHLINRIDPPHNADTPRDHGGTAA